MTFSASAAADAAIEARRDKLRRMLKASTSGGEAVKGYGERVTSIRAEIDRLERITKA